MNAVFFSEHVDAVLSIPNRERALDRLTNLIAEAQVEKDVGRGPPRSEIDMARRKWLDLYAELYGAPA